MTTHSSVLAWRIPGTAEPGGLPSMGSGRTDSDTTEATQQQQHIIRIIHHEQVGFTFGMQECFNLGKWIWIAHTLTE